MSHEKSETVQDPESGWWVNVYGKGTKKAGERLPEDPSGYGHREYYNMSDAADEAQLRSEAYRPKKPERKRK